jgi:hypothetical protein
MIRICLDLDGTLFDLYGKSNWLDLLTTETAGAFEGEFLPEIDVPKLYRLARLLNALKVKIDVVTWLPMDCSKEYGAICTAEKEKWVRTNLPFVDKIYCIDYGIPKQTIGKKAQTMYLIDDNEKVCADWQTAKQRKAFNVNREYTIVNAFEDIIKAIA